MNISTKFMKTAFVLIAFNTLGYSAYTTSYMNSCRACTSSGANPISVNCNECDYNCEDVTCSQGTSVSCALTKEVKVKNKKVTQNLFDVSNQNGNLTCNYK